MWVKSKEFKKYLVYQIKHYMKDVKRTIEI